MLSQPSPQIEKGNYIPLKNLEKEFEEKTIADINLDMAIYMGEKCANDEDIKLFIKNTIIKDEYRKEFFSLEQKDQIELVNIHNMPEDLLLSFIHFYKKEGVKINNHLFGIHRLGNNLEALAIMTEDKKYEKIIKIWEGKPN